MPFTEDLDVFLDDADFAVEALYNSTATVRVILDAAYMEIGGLAGTNPVAVGKATDFPAASAVGKTLVIDSVSYVIRNREPQEDGAMVALQLEQQ